MKDLNGAEQTAMHVFTLAIKHVKVSGIIDRKTISLYVKAYFRSYCVN